MISQRVSTLLVVAPALALATWLSAAETKTHKLTSVSPKKMADSLHAVIAADNRAYVEGVVERRAALARAGASAADAIPNHAQLLRAANQNIQKKGAEFSYTLRSLTPLNPSQGPQTEVEQQGIAFVTENPGQNFYTEEELGGRAYFTAVFAERATLRSCVDCHNQHPKAVRKDLKEGDVLGALVIRIPLEF